ncbi:MAG: ribonuclease Z [Muribaculaceae bacterium]|nr:ribonuclease Z [Muribaculaceae bacterium]
MDFQLDILGTGSAVPSYGRFSSSQVLTTHNKSFMIDCADGTQFQMRSKGIRNNRLGHIFLSHLHGDHCFGLMAFISTLGMLNHTSDLYLHAQPDLRPLLEPWLKYFCDDLTFHVYFEDYDPLKHAVIYEDRSLTVETIPLVHGVPTSGFLFKEKPKTPHLDGELLKFYDATLHQIQEVKAGKDLVTADGKCIPNARFVTPATPQKSYAYCSDTAYCERIIPIIEGADVLFHESTFGEAEAARARATKHSTARQAATIAQKAGVGQLILGHYSARYATLEHLLQEAQEIFPNTILSHEGDHLVW